MANWENTRVNLGTLKEGEVVNFSFMATRKLEGVSFEKGCGSCTTIVSFDGYELKVKYKAEVVPPQVQGVWKPNKWIVAHYEDGTSETLYFLPLIEKK